MAIESREQAEAIVQRFRYLGSLWAESNNHPSPRNEARFAPYREEFSGLWPLWEEAEAWLRANPEPAAPEDEDSWDDE